MPEQNQPLIEAAILSTRWSNKTIAGESKRLQTDRDYRIAVVARLRETADKLEAAPLAERAAAPVVTAGEPDPIPAEEVEPAGN